MKFSNKAFTLAEIVIALAVVGIVAVLATFNANKDTDEATKIALLRSTYNILDAAYKQASLGSDDISTILGDMKDYLQISKNCGTGIGCFQNDVILKSPALANTSNIHPSLTSNSKLDSVTADVAYKLILKNGASILVSKTNKYVYVDVNGPKKGNSVTGDDVFYFVADAEKGLYPYGYDCTFSKTAPGCPYQGEYCTAWAILMGNMDYLRCPEKLSWTDKSKTTCNQ